MSTRSTFARGALLAAGLTVARAGHAQNAPPPATPPSATPPPAGDAATEAEALIQRGVEARRRGDDNAALELFRQAFARQVSARAQAQIALAEQALGQWASAERDLRAALAMDDPWIAGFRATLEGSLRTIQSHLGSLDVQCNVQGAEVLVNGDPVGQAPFAQPVRVETGTVTIEVRANGYVGVRRVLEVAAGQSYRERFRLTPQPAGTQAGAGDDTTTTTTSTRGASTGGVVVAPHPPLVARNDAALAWSNGLLIGGAVGLAGGIAAHIYWQTRVALYNSDACFVPTDTYPTRSARCDLVLGNVWLGFGLTVTGYVLGGAAMLTGLILRVTSAGRGGGAADTARGATAWACGPGPGALGLACGRAF